MPPKSKPVFGKYTGRIEPDTTYLCRSDNNIVKVEGVSKPNGVWVVDLRYIQSHTKKGQSVSIVEFDFVKDIESKKFVKL
jgi:hypothetical protein